ncbi:MAG: triose-phosphate isomerase [Pseudomonadales bacterium]|jgi:triosephosphate isomerase|nr:triose-phosphate isomerase [Pseudomonadales bacterium]MEC8811921.1 triose-phosphate isomerase [Pseudomonadota bacterium]HAU14552.1 triose-phosphate isomerase [Gammaproteobacteria bacterium]MAQ26587.1 triose-phosphate isomerase [Pseudomonadales bacterium]MBI26320.1 triose-phosphate isomerase [Pseudomonadales bacterium]|tara:strand:+ start:14850 stop:15599 length:750 start_codon:yes stop_codon:yes gene_type:complete
MRTPVVAGNWKMNGSKSTVTALLQGLKQGLNPGRASVVVCAPFPFLGLVADELSGSAIQWGAQNASQYPAGAYTGEVSVGMLQEFGCSHVILGHSERRALFSEQNEQIAAKFMAVIDAGLTPILCVGETLEQREAGTTAQVVEEQLMAVVDAAGVIAFSKAILAYEPVWAIGTGRTASPQQAQEVHETLRKRLAAVDGAVADKLPILYGGSVKAANAAELFACPDIDGGLIGGASLDAEAFLAICHAAE